MVDTPKRTMMFQRPELGLGSRPCRRPSGLELVAVVGALHPIPITTVGRTIEPIRRDPDGFAESDDTSIEQ